MKKLLRKFADSAIYIWACLMTTVAASMFIVLLEYVEGTRVIQAQNVELTAQNERLRSDLEYNVNESLWHKRYAVKPKLAPMIGGEFDPPPNRPTLILEYRF